MYIKIHNFKTKIIILILSKTFVLILSKTFVIIYINVSLTCIFVLFFDANVKVKIIELLCSHDWTKKFEDNLMQSFLNRLR